MTDQRNEVDNADPISEQDPYSRIRPHFVVRLAALNVG